MPPLGIVGAGLALVASYLVVLALMYVFTQRLFPVPYEWGRLARVARDLRRAWSASASCSCPPRALAGLLGRIALWLAYPLALLASGFFTPGERRWLARLRHPGDLVAQLPRPAPARPPAVDGALPEAYEAEQMDEDSPPHSRLDAGPRRSLRPSTPAASAWRAWAQ